MRVRRALGFIVLLTLGSQSGATTYPRKPTMQDLAQAWIGIGPSGYEVYRLELNMDGTGILTSTWNGSPGTMAYRIASTSLSEYKVAFILIPADAKQAPPYLRGQATPGRLDLEIGERKSEWKTRMYFHTEARLLASLKALTDRAGAERAK